MIVTVLACFVFRVTMNKQKAAQFLAMLPADSSPQSANLLSRYAYWTAIRGQGDVDDAPSPPELLEVNFGSLDEDSVRAVADHLPTRAKGVCRDERSPSLVALASTCKTVRSFLQPNVVLQQRAHAARLRTLDVICLRLGTSLHAMQAACKSFATPGEGVCASCGRAQAYRSGLFVRTTCARQQLADEEVLARDGAHCPHCWRAAFEMSMRPLSTGQEQTWEEEVDYSAGGFMMVQDFSGVDDLDSPLLAREEYSEVWPFAHELVDELCASGYVLLGACHAMREDAHTEWALTLSAEERAALVTWDMTRSLLLADLLTSGYCDQLLSLDLSEAGVDDPGLELLSRGLVGNALQLQFIDLSSNPIGDDGICALAGLLAPRHFELMLPLLRWLHLVLEPGLGDRGSCALAAAMSAMAMPSLELLWATSERFDEALAASPAEILEGQHPGFAALTSACVQRSVTFEVDHQGVVWGGHAIAQNAFI